MLAPAAPEPAAPPSPADEFDGAVAADLGSANGAAEEAAFLAEMNAPAAPPAESMPVAAALEPPLPALDEALARVPAALRETLDELFRARFTRVRRIPTAALKG